MVQTPIKSLTLEEFLQLPETKPASEYIDGQIIQKLMPQGKHSTVRRDLTFAIDTDLKPNRIGRAYPELRCVFGGRAIVPDISVFVTARIARDENGEVANMFPLAPDWAIEILSPDQSQTKIIKKILHCLEHGTQIAWIIDPEEKTIFVYFPQRSAEFFDLEAPDEQIPVPEFAKDLDLTAKRIFGWLEE